jgi:anaerobic nitric oxide reductase transcription regulator
MREGEGLRDAVTRLERDLVEAALARNDYNWAAAARALGMDRGNLARLAKRLGIAGKGAAQPARAGVTQP